MNRISEETLLPLGLVLLVLAAVASFAKLQSESLANSKEIRELKDDQKSYSEKIDRVLQKLGRIEGKLGIQ